MRKTVAQSPAPRPHVSVGAQTVAVSHRCQFQIALTTTSINNAASSLISSRGYLPELSNARARTKNMRSNCAQQYHTGAYARAGEA
jgi:hypothetical protein